MLTYPGSTRLLTILLTTALIPIGCATMNGGGRLSYEPSKGPFRLFEEVEAAPSEDLARERLRDDVDIRTLTGSPTPAVIATSEIPALILSPRSKVSLAGDQEGESDWSVNNFVLFEVIVEDRVTDRFTVGFHDPAYIGPEMLESVGAYSPRFEARSPVISARLPTATEFVLRATALSYRTVGAVSSLWLLIEEDDGEPDFRALRD